MRKRKLCLMILGVALTLLISIEISYAYWILNLKQDGENNLVSSCFNISFTEGSQGIHLDKAYPIVDADGEKLEPYTFTITNNCAGNVQYQINLETMNTEKRLDSEYIKEKLNIVGEDGVISLLTENPKNDKTIVDGALEGYQLKVGFMGPNEEKKFELRLWVDESVTADNPEIMNPTFSSKVSIVATYIEEIPKTLQDTILTVPTVTKGSGLYQVTNDTGSLEDVGWKETELRYAGPSEEVHNYVTFNNENAGWRIIGLVNVLVPQADGPAKVEQRVKIVRASSIGDKAWDAKGSVMEDDQILDPDGSNDWTDSELMQHLNGTYYNSLSPIAQKMIDQNIRWNIGAIGSSFQFSSFSQLYQLERGTETGNEKPSEWGADNTKNAEEELDSSLFHSIALIYPSDFYTATSKQEETESHFICYDQYEQYSGGCSANSWLRPHEFSEISGTFWTLTTSFGDSETLFAYALSPQYDFGSFSDYSIFPAETVYGAESVYPSLYLEPSVLVLSGDGSIENPYVLSLE